MSLVACIALALLYSQGVQPMEDVHEESDDIFDLLNDAERNIPEIFVRRKRSNDPKCPELTRINNGYDVNDGIYPFVVALIRWENPPKVSDQFCVGILVTFGFVLTACHCLVYADGDGVIRYPHNLIVPRSIDVLAGATDLKEYLRSRRLRNIDLLRCGQVREGQKIRVHPGCSLKNNTFKYDIGILKIKYTFRVEFFTKCQVRPKFPLTKLTPRDVVSMAENHEVCVTVGWGVDVDAYTSPYLQMAWVTLRPGDWCKQTITNVTIDQEGGPDVFVPNLQLCVLGCETGQTVCAGDSGGPLICGPNKDVIGVVSYGPGNASCGNDQIPFVYSRVEDDNQDWVTDIIANLTSTRGPRRIHVQDSTCIPKSHMYAVLTATVVIIVIKELLY